MGYGPDIFYQDTYGSGLDAIFEIENLTGSSFNDTLTGSSSDNNLIGGSGDDTLDGGAGNDIITGGAGGDRIIGGAGNDIITGGAGDDRIIGGAGFDIVSYSDATAGVSVHLWKTYAQAGVDGDNTNFSAGVGSDTLSQIEGIIGSDYGDFFGGNNSSDVAIWGGAGNDSIAGSNGGNDYIDGGSGSDIVWAGTGDDTLVGGLGNDTLDGGSGSDTVVLTGAYSNYVLSNVNGSLTITDSRVQASDGIDTLSSIEFLQFSDRLVSTTNAAPTSIELSTSSIAENNIAGAVVATLSATDPDGVGTGFASPFTYALVSGDGDTDNSAFTIVGDQLRINGSANFESKSSYTVRLEVTDAGGLTYQSSKTISVNDVNEAPILSSDGSFSLGSRQDYPAGSFPHSVGFYDLNADGLTDVLVGNEFSQSVSIYYNQGSGVLAPAVSVSTGGRSAYAYAADVDGDGTLDVVTANYYDGTVSVLSGIEGGGFSSPVVYGVGGASVITLALADIDNDGDVDIVAPIDGQSKVQVLLNDGGGNFSLGSSHSVGSAPNVIVSADLNGDGFADVVTSNIGSLTTSVLLNDGAGGFLQQQAYSTGGWVVAVGDVNSDGRADFVTAIGASNAIGTWLNDGQGSFALYGTSAAGPSVGSVYLARSIHQVSVHQ